jgi:sulfate permease, SulP family
MDAHPDVRRPFHLRLFAAAWPGSRAAALRDMVAGASLASMNIPQALGYTRIAETPLATGLYTLLLPLIAFAAFGSSRHLVAGPDSATAAIFSSALSQMADPYSDRYMALVATVALITAAFLLLARVFRLGFLADFLSRTVLVGFLTGVGVQVGIAMLGDMLAVPVHASNTLMQALEVARGLPVAHVPTLVLSLIVVAILLVARRFVPHAPVPLLVVVASIVASAAFDFSARGITTIHPVPGGLPGLALPTIDWRDLMTLLPVAGSCFVIIIAQSAVTARAYADRHREYDDANADILGLSAANAVSAVSGGFVVNGSPTQTAMAENVGARSQLAQIVFAILVGVVLMALTGPLHYLPRCVLAGIVFSIAVGMIDIRGMEDIRRESIGEWRLALLTAASVVGLGVEPGILLAAAFSLFRHVRHSYRPHSEVLTPHASGQWEPEPPHPGMETEPGLIVYRFAADLFYANADSFAREVRTLIESAPEPVRCFVVDAGAITDIDFSAARVLRELVADLAHRRIVLILARVRPYFLADLQRHGVAAALGPGRVFETLHEGLAAAKALLERTPPHQ